jgi:protein-disulfide isomerase
VAHVLFGYRIPLVIGILAALAGCGRDANPSEIAALRNDIAELKSAQAKMQTTLAALQQQAMGPPAGEVSVGEDGVPREVVRRIPTRFNPRKGSEVAAVTVIEFADFQCPYCQAAAGLSDELLKEFPDDIQFVFKHYPLAKHVDAFDAAKASWAAHQQGKFWQMHNMIYGGDIQTLPPEVLRGYAEKIGLDMARYDADVDSDLAIQAVMFDRKAAKNAKVRGTPTYFVNGKRVANSTPAGVQAKVRAEVDAYRKGSRG